MQLRSNKELDAARIAVQRIGAGRLLFWFFAINFPVALVLSATIGWHNSVVGSPTGVDLLARGVAVIVALAVSGTMFVFKVRSLSRKK